MKKPLELSKLARQLPFKNSIDSHEAMAGHNKWSKVKRLKAVTDSRKNAVFTKILKEIMVAAKNGKDPDANARLRKAISDARAASVPKDNIERAIKKGAGELEGGQIEELIYEGYGPGGVAILVEALTDNRLRTQPEIRKIFDKNGGSLGEMGSVAWGFSTKGVFLVPKDQASEDSLMNIVLEAGADDLTPSDEGYEIQCSPENFESVRSALEAAHITPALAELGPTPSSKVTVTPEIAVQIESLVSALEDHDDVQKVVSNAES